ncbi:MAG: biotin-dependent carboxyltransferase family protein [Actinomycetota bacterium]
MNVVAVLQPGTFTTIQDLGRFGFQRYGVTPSGAMDALALRAANLLVGNDPGQAGLEITLRGPTLEFERSALIAICGADLSPSVDDLPLLGWRAIYVQGGSVLRFGACRWGCRAYLAVGGGIDVPAVMGSRSTYVRAGIGGIEGRALGAGDRLSVGKPAPSAAALTERVVHNLGPMSFAMSERRAPPRLLEHYDPDRAVRVLRGPHFELFSAPDRDTFLGKDFAVSERSDRMGYRLSGHELRSAKGTEIVSTAVLAGTVQVPPGGEPIVLMADRQTTGGYPIIAQVAEVELSWLAQRKPGDTVNFVETTMEDAHLAARDQEELLRSLIEEGEADVSS